MIKIMKQTAVEWLIENVLLQPTTKEEVEHNISIFKIAKGLEEERIKDALKAGVNFEIRKNEFKSTNLTYSQFFEKYIKDNYED